ncbi:immunoglobulin superfamily member 1-like [Natator depressus]|uniref:immunoglobulin superfamily member 1-like n=1 Tax=Natator depressus TaxID=27790 RepID=UPI003EBE3C1A
MELPAPGPSISAIPSEVIALQGAVTIHCQCRCEARRLFLYKGGIEIWKLDTAGDIVEITIPSARREDGGAYSCRPHSGSEPPNWSDPSDIVRIVVDGGAVTIRCRGRHQKVRFLLYQDGNPNGLQDAEPAGDMAEFPISSVSRRDAGRYSCRYSTKPDLPVWSEPSDPVELVVAEGSLPKASISVSPGGVIPVGGNVTIQCWHQRLGMRFLLYKDGDGNYLRYTDPAGYVAEFPIPSARREHGGSYTCRYSYRTGPAAYSEPSDPVQIIVAGEGPSPAPRLPAPHPARPPGGLSEPWCPADGTSSPTNEG